MLTCEVKGARKCALQSNYCGFHNVVWVQGAPLGSFLKHQPISLGMQLALFYHF